MKQITAKSGIKGYQCKLQDNYSNFEDFVYYDEIYNLAARLGFSTTLQAWKENPTIQGSTNPDDFRITPTPAKQSKMNNTESKEPLYRQLNKERTQGDWDFGYGDDSKALGIYTKKMLEEGLNESPVCLVSPIEKMNDTDKANAQYICLATNNLSSLAEALETLIDRLNTNWDAITAGGQKGILTALTKEAKEALLKIS